MNLSSLFRGTAKSKIEISSPHQEQGPMQSVPATRAREAMPSIVPNAHRLAGSNISVPGKMPNATTAAREPLCNMEEVQWASRHLDALVDLRKDCKPGCFLKLDQAVTNAFLMAVATDTVRSLINFQIIDSRSGQYGHPHFHLNITDDHALEKLDTAMLKTFSHLKDVCDVRLEQFHPNLGKAETLALAHIQLLTISMIYDFGGAIDPERLAAKLDLKWSPHMADAVLLETFAPVIRADARTNWMSVTEILKHSEHYRAPKPAPSSGSGSTGTRTGQTSSPGASQASGQASARSGASAGSSARSRPADDRDAGARQQAGQQPGQQTGPQTGQHTAPPPSTSHSTSSSHTASTSAPYTPSALSYDAALADARRAVARHIGKEPPAFHIHPACEQSLTGRIVRPGNLLQFFGMSATDKSAEALRQVKRQYKDILLEVHPDKCPRGNPEAERAYREVTQQYTVAFNEVKKWFDSPGA